MKESIKLIRITLIILLTALYSNSIPLNGTYTIGSGSTGKGFYPEASDKLDLSQNYPDPINPSTVIRYSLSENSFVTLKVYDVVGNEVATLVSEKQNSGTYNYQFSTVNYQLSSGVYFYKIEAGSFSAVKRMIIIK